MHKSLVLFALTGLAFASTPAQDPVKVAAKQCKVEFENEYVRVLRWTVGPQEKVVMHEHPALVSISLAASKTRFTTSDGKTRDVDAKPGQVTWSGPERHSSQDLGDRASEIIQVELKKKPAAAMTAIPASEDSVKVDPKHYNIEFQNDQVRVLRIKYGPGEKSVMHAHPAGVAVFLTDGQTKFTLPDGKTTVSDLKAGQVMWEDRQEHLPANAGGKLFELILVELR